MKMSLFAIRDVKVERFFPPFMQTTQLEAQRTFLDMCRDERTPLSKHPEDYTLYEVGTFDVESGELASVVARVVLIGSEAANAA